MTEEEASQPIHQTNRKLNKQKRVVLKGGSTSVTYKNISKKRRRYFSDLYTTLLDSSWNYCVLMFTTSFYGSWLFFGSLYFMICYMHGDLLEENLPGKKSGWVPCIKEIDGFASCFLFSLETQHTIGYGSRQTTTKCPDAMLVVSVQVTSQYLLRVKLYYLIILLKAVLGCIIQAFMVGLVFSKLSRPRNRSKTIIFSNQAVVNQRNGKLCLIIRIGDLRDDNFILGTQISAKLLRRRISQEGEIFQEMKNLKISPDTTEESCIFFVWPLDIVHVIDEESPFYEISEADLVKERFELLVVMEGTNETSNMTFQARTSYLPQEIMWGHRFEQMLLYRRDHNKFQVNFSAFHSTYEVDTPLCSARNLEEYLKRSLRNPDMLRNELLSLEGSDLSRLSYIDTNSLLNRTINQEILRENGVTRNSVSRANSHLTKNNANSLLRRPEHSQSNPDEASSQQEPVNWLLGSCEDDTKITAADPVQSREIK